MYIIMGMLVMNTLGAVAAPEGGDEGRGAAK